MGARGGETHVRLSRREKCLFSSWNRFLVLVDRRKDSRNRLDSFSTIRVNFRCDGMKKETFAQARFAFGIGDEEEEMITAIERMSSNTDVIITARG